MKEDEKEAEARLAKEKDFFLLIFEQLKLKAKKATEEMSIQIFDKTVVTSFELPSSFKQFGSSG